MSKIDLLMTTKFQSRKFNNNCRTNQEMKAIDPTPEESTRASASAEKKIVKTSKLFYDTKWLATRRLKKRLERSKFHQKTAFVFKLQAVEQILRMKDKGELKQKDTNCCLREMRHMASDLWNEKIEENCLKTPWLHKMIETVVMENMKIPDRESRLLTGLSLLISEGYTIDSDMVTNLAN